MSEAQEKYNQVAVKYAEKVHQEKLENQHDSLEQASVEKLFPAHNRSGLGVYLEYERMGNTPVTDELQDRANELGVRFEPLGNL